MTRLTPSALGVLKHSIFSQFMELIIARIHHHRYHHVAPSPRLQLNPNMHTVQILIIEISIITKKGIDVALDSRL